jgi:nitrogen regulatory protein P-II 1
MKEIKAMIQPFMLSKVVDALHKVPGFPGLTVTKVQGFGREKGQGAKHKIVEDLIEYVPKVKLEIVVNDEMLDVVVRTIQGQAHTGNKGDGKIFIYDVKDAIRIMTGERGDSAV